MGSERSFECPGRGMVPHGVPPHSSFPQNGGQDIIRDKAGVGGEGHDDFLQFM